MDKDEDAGDEFSPWTPDGAARLQGAAVDLAAALKEHTEALTAATGHADMPQVVAASDRLLPALLAYADAQFGYTGYGFPFGTLYEYVDDDDDEGQADSEDETPATGISVLQRHDYRVTDEAAVLAAGRKAYLRVWPDDGQAAADADVTHLGRALYQVAHADGWHSLERLEGLRPTGGCVTVASQDNLLGPDPDHWPEDLYTGAGEILFGQDDVYPG